MNSIFSIELPESVREVVTQQALDLYTVDGPNQQRASQIDQLEIPDLFPNGVTNNDMAKCCLAGIWLLHNFLDRSHAISQEISTREGSYWHGIMHRLEGDFGNSKYWYRKVGEHPIYKSMLGDANWDPSEFVDQCESAQSTGTPTAASVQRIAVAEWKALFEYCFTAAS